MSIHEYGAQVDVQDPWTDPDVARPEYGLDLVATHETRACDGIVLVVAHDAFRYQGAVALRRHGRGAAVFCDLKNAFAPQDSDLRL